MAKKKFNPTGLVLTEEQERIVSHDYKKGESVAVKAFAGAGKTSTLQMLSNSLKIQNPKWKILYLAFNKSVQAEAEKKFESNVEPRTTHSLAYASVGKKYRHKLNPTVRLKTIVEVFNVHSADKWKIATATWKTLKAFIESDSTQFTADFVHYDAPRDRREYVFKLAVTLWKRMADIEDSEIPMTHDGYLKLYHLSKPDLASEYDMIMVDEAQDSNPTFVDIVNSQKNCSTIWIGDDHQSIYQFRGSTNAFKKIDITHTFYLSKSFRFGGAIAKVANAILSTRMGEKLPLEGNDIKDCIITAEELEYEEKYTIINRTNAGLFNNAVEMINEGLKFGIVGGVSGSGVDTILDVYNLYKNNKRDIKDAFIKTFFSYDKLIDYAKGTEDLELLRIIKTISIHESRIPQLIDDIKSKAVPINRANIILTTAHKCKGLEFPVVCLDNDFVDLTKPLTNPPKIEEFNLLYVALTRGMKKLKLNNTLEYIMSNYESTDE